MKTVVKTLQRREEAAQPTELKGLHPLLARLYAARGIEDLQQVSYSLEHLADYRALKNIDVAVQRLALALKLQQSILIVGDYDADGATSTALAIRCLTKMGATKLDYLLPNRFDFGYGLTPEIVDVAARSNPDLIITVDNGISSVEGVERANQHGIEVLVTDHHLPPETVPNAFAIVNPNQEGDEFSSKSLAGVGVIFYLLAALRRHLRSANWFEQQNLAEPSMADYLDLVALGTVADVVPLDQNNRILVEQGLRRIRSGKAVPGILALLRLAKKNHRKTIATDLGFTVGPRLNAAGRLDDMSIGIECLLTDDQTLADQYAGELDAYNRQRREVEQDMQTEALALCEQIELDTDELPWGLCLNSKSWHQGVVGLVASRLKERIHRPVIAFAPTEEGKTWKGSGRSIPGLHLRDALARMNSRQPDLIDKFGGHAMAAGLSIQAEKLPEFAKIFAATVKEMTPAWRLQPIIVSDGEVKAAEMTIQTAHMLRNCGPWGQLFPEPVFDGEFTIAGKQDLRGGFTKFRLQSDAAPVVDALLFEVLESLPEPGDKIHIAYQLSVNDFQGTESLQIIIKSLFN